MEGLWSDLRFAFRSLARTPGFTAVVVLTLALGIGATTGIFSAVWTVLLRPLSLREPHRLVVIEEAHRSSRSSAPLLASPRTFFAAREHVTSFDGVAAATVQVCQLTGGGEPEIVQRGWVTANLFAVLGAVPELGRTFPAGAHSGDDARSVVLGHDLWQRRFGADPAAIGRTVTLDDIAFTVIGVMPPDFQLPDSVAQLWALPLHTEVPDDPFQPQGHDLRQYTGPYLRVVARLRPGASPAAAASELDAVISATAARGSENEPAPRVAAIPFASAATSRHRVNVLALFGAAAILLAVAAANVVNLMRTRTAARAREIATRIALGATRGRIVRQLLTESIPLVLLGGVAGSFLAWLGVAAFHSAAGRFLPPGSAPTVDVAVLAFATAVSALVGVATAVSPARMASRQDLAAVVKGHQQTGRTHRRTWRRRDLLVAAQAALALVLAIGAGLLAGTVVRLQAVDPGFRPDRLLTFRTQLARTRYTSAGQARAFFDAALARIGALPGVQAATVVNRLPSGSGGFRATVLSELSFAVRTEGDPLAMAAAIREAVRSADAQQPVSELATMEGVLAEPHATRRLIAALFVVFGVAACALAAIGVYGVLACTVGERTHELGIRIALGASRGAVMRYVVSQGLAAVGAGAAAGLVVALFLGRFVRHLLFGVTATDPPTFAGATACLLVVALLACLPPAFRALRIQPITALRYE